MGVGVRKGVHADKFTQSAQAWLRHAVRTRLFPAEILRTLRVRTARSWFAHPASVGPAPLRTLHRVLWLCIACHPPRILA